ncbi:MAG: hypothetical protein R2724_30140 [Bryobacterales bacterium]
MSASSARRFYVAHPERIEYRVHSATDAGMVNQDGAVIITAGSTPTAALLAAFETWNQVAGTTVAFATPTPEPDGAAMPDGINLVTFEDTPNNRALTFGAIAVTRLLSDVDGALEDTDIVFNPEMPFSTTLEEGTFDIQGTLTHGSATPSDSTTAVRRAR